VYISHFFTLQETEKSASRPAFFKKCALNFVRYAGLRNDGIYSLALWASCAHPSHILKHNFLCF